MVDRKPTLAGYARVSYLRELHGDLDGAVAAMRRAVAAGGPARENVAAVQALLGELELAPRPAARPRGAQRAALAAVPGYPAAEAGLARLAAARGDLAGASRRWRALVAAAAAARVRDRARRGGARRRPPAAPRGATFALVGARAAAAGAPPRRHRRRARASSRPTTARRGARVALARRAWRAAPGLRAADALGWALTRAGRPADGLRWARRAIALGRRDPLLRFHAGMAALAAGCRPRAGAAAGALAHGLAGWPWQAARRAALTCGVVAMRAVDCSRRRSPRLALGRGGRRGPRGRTSARQLLGQPPLRGDARFVDEDVGARIVQRLGVLPVTAGGSDVRPTLLVGVYRFF